MSSNSSDSIAADLLPGAQRIADFIGEPVQVTYYGLEKGYIPATKKGRLWIGSKSRLREHYGLPTGKPSAATVTKQVEAEAVAPVPRTLSRRLPSHKSKQAKPAKRKQRARRARR
jgi:hypothetical protein